MPRPRAIDVFRVSAIVAGVVAGTIAVVLLMHFIMEGHGPLSHPHDTLILASLVLVLSVFLFLWRRYP